MTPQPDTEGLLLEAIQGLRSEVVDLTRKVSALSENAAREKGLAQGLAIDRRLQHVERDMQTRPTAEQIGEMLDNRLRKFTNRAIIGAFAAAPAWMGAGVALAAYLGR